MQKLVVGMLAMLTSFAVQAKNDFPNVDAEKDFPNGVYHQLRGEMVKNNCSRQYYENFVKAQIGLPKGKLEWLADTLCDQPDFLDYYLSMHIETADFRSFTGVPVLLAFQAIPDLALEQISRIIFEIAISNDFTRKHTRIYDLNAGGVFRGDKLVPITPGPLEKGKQNVFNVDLDKWIADREAKNRNELLQWASAMLQSQESSALVMVVSKYDADYYRNNGHPEAALFLSYFKPIHFNGDFKGDKPKARTCNEEL